MIGLAVLSHGESTTVVLQSKYYIYFIVILCNIKSNHLLSLISYSLNYIYSIVYCTQKWQNNGIVFATDQIMRVTDFVNPLKFNPTLIGKPKVKFNKNRYFSLNCETKSTFFYSFASFKHAVEANGWTVGESNLESCVKVRKKKFWILQKKGGLLVLNLSQIYKKIELRCWHTDSLRSITGFHVFSGPGNR